MGINLAGLGSVPLVIAAALALAGLSPRLRARGGDAARLVALSLVLCGLVLGTGVSALASTGGVGFDQEIYTFFRRPPDLVIGVDLRLDPIAAIVAAVVLIAALCDALAQIVRGGAWAGALRLSIAVSGALAVSLGRSLLVIGVGWLAVAIACRFGQARARLASAGALLWFALVGAFVAAASLDVLAIERVGIAGRSGAFVRGALLGAPLAVTVGAALVGVAALVGRVGPERDEGPLFSPVELLLAIVALLRVNTIFALSPGLGAALVLGGLGVAIAAGLPDRNDARARLGSVHGGLAIAAAGLAAWDAALLLALGSALAGVGLRLARSSEGPWTSRISRALASGAAPGGVAIGIAGLVVAGCTHHSALGSLAAWIVPAGALAASLVAGYVASGASPGRDCSDPAVARGLAWALWLPSFGVVALALPLAAGAPIARFLGPIIAMSRSLEGLPTGPRV
ncbi:MAG: hypothetical protein R3A51_01120, partial [Nannocystaceae bacterium]